MSRILKDDLALAAYKGRTCHSVSNQDTMLEKLVKPLNNTMFNNQEWSFQQGSMPGNKSRSIPT